ncbi:MAG: M48 family metallopeptidase [Caulobacter sp.]|nr:M48 family metallopeptidase [Caulobacter sp.]
MNFFSRSSFTHGERIEADGQPVRLAVNARARRISLRVDRVKREAIAVAPSARRLPEAVAFARERADWIASQLADLPQAAPLRPDMQISLFGKPVRLVAAPGRARLVPASDEVEAVIAAPDDAAFGDRVMRLIKAEARRWLTDRTVFHSTVLDRPTPRIAITDTRGRWGSCRQASLRGPASIRYSWRLALAPAEVADYVAAHECAHLIEANHGPRFWALVRELNGDPAPHRAWLKREGARLQAVGRS